MQQENTPASAGTRPTPVQATAYALRSLGQVYDIQVATTRLLLQGQARAAAAFGWPDWSGVFDQADDRTRHLFATSAEQLVEATQRANDAATELQQQLGRVVQSQAAAVADSVQHSLQEIGEQTGEGLRQLYDSARQQAEQAERVAQSAGQEWRDSLREGSAQARQAFRDAAASANAATSAATSAATNAVTNGLDGLSANDDRSSRRRNPPQASAA